MNVDSCVFGSYSELDARHNFHLTLFNSDRSRCPISETLRCDDDLIGSPRLYIIKFEETIFGGDECTGIITFRRVENNCRIGYGITVDIGNYVKVLELLRPETA